MPGPFSTKSGVVRLTPSLAEVQASRSAKRESASQLVPAATSGKSSSKASINTDGPVVDPATQKEVPPEVIADAQAKAAAGDQLSIDWLKTLGLVGGAVVGGSAIAKLASDRLAKEFVDPAGQGVKGTTVDPMTNSRGQRLLPNPVKLLPAPSGVAALPAPAIRQTDSTSRLPTIEMTGPPQTSAAAAQAAAVANRERDLAARYAKSRALVKGIRRLP